MDENWITEEQILERSRSFNDFEASIDDTVGSLNWYNKKLEVTIYATPNWVVYGKVPFDVSEADWKYVSDVRLTLTGNIDQQYEQYMNMLKSIMDKYTNKNYENENY